MKSSDDKRHKPACSSRCPTEEAKGTKCTACLDVDNLEKEIQATTALLVAMQEQRLKLLSKVNHSHDPLLRRFSPEIIAEIFQHTLFTRQELHEVRTYIVISRWQGPHILTAVCKSWRELTLGTPSLWTIIPIILANDRYNQVARTARLWARRSGTMPLSVFFKFADNDYDPDDCQYNGRRIEKIMRGINSISHRLVYICAQGPYVHLKHICLDNSPNLQWVELVDTSRYIPELHKKIIVDNGPQIRPTVLIPDMWWPTRLQIATSHLRDAELTGIAVSECLKLIANAPHLQSLTVDQYVLVQSNDTSSITHSGIQTLKVSGDDHTLCSLMRSLRLPSLLSLHLVEGADRPYARDAEKHTPVLKELLGLLQRSLSPLQELTLQRLGTKNPKLVEQEENNKILSDIMSLVGPTIRELDFNSPINGEIYNLRHLQDLFDSVFVPWDSLSHLKSVTICAGAYWWSHLMCWLVKAVATGKWITPRPTVVIYHNSDDVCNASEGLFLSCFNKPKISDPATNAPHPHSRIVAPEIYSSEIEEMLSTIDTHGISFKIFHLEGEDMFPDIRSHLLELCGGSGTTQ